MKLTRFSLFFFTASFILLLSITGCDSCNRKVVVNDPIPVDTARAQEHIISIDEAVQYTKRFHDSRNALYSNYLKDSLLGGKKVKLITAEYFNRDAIAALLNKVDSTGGIRIYFGQDTNGTIKLVLVPATRRRDIITDIITKRSNREPGVSSALAEEGQAVERGQAECPNMCPDESPLVHQNP